MYIMSKKIKKLSLHYSYLRLEEEEVTEICEEVESEMRSALKEHHPQEFDIFYGPSINAPEEIPNIPNELEEKIEEGNKNPDVKKLYRRIAKKIHPDKKEGGNEEQFKRAAVAYSENNVAVLLEIAAQHNIELTALSEETIELMKSNIKTLQEEIHTKKGSSSWAFSQAQTPEQKLDILAQIAKHIKENSHAKTN